MTKRLRDEEFDGPSSPDSEIIETPNPPDIQKPQATSNSTPQASSKFVHLGEETGEALTVMRCSLPGHQRTLSFLSFDDYEVHYKKSHMNRCLECRKNLPSEHFLNLHIEENHDALVSVRKDRGEKIQYDFFVVNDGIDHKSSMLRSGRHGHRRHSSAAKPKVEEVRQRAATTEPSLNNQGIDQEFTSRPGVPPAQAEDDAMEVSETAASVPEPEDDQMKGLETAMSSLRFVPSSVRFGRGRGRGRGFSKA
ncbi:hypothetical protein ACHAPF_001201 [Botrytis cinerea]